MCVVKLVVLEDEPILLIRCKVVTAGLYQVSLANWGKETPNIADVCRG